MLWDLSQFNDNVALLTEDSSVTYKELLEQTEEIAAGIEERSLVFFLTRNVIGSVAGYVSFINHGIVPLMIDEDINEDILDTLIGQYRPAYLWLPEDREAQFGEATVVKRLLGYTLMSFEQKHPYKLCDELGLLITTSGSTGSPKLVRQSYRNLESNARAIIEYLKIDEHERAITSLPMNYVYGLSVINTHLYAGATLLLTEENCYSKRFWQLFNEKEATSFAGVPFMYEMLNKLKITKKELPTLKTMTQAGGKLSKELQDFYCSYAREVGKQFIIMYGASEATSRMGYLPFEASEEKRGSIGIPIPGGRYEIIDADGGVIDEPDVVGELVYYGENVTLGYARCGEDLEKGDENHGRLETGDMAYRDEDGFYFIAGRKKRFLKMLGKRTSLDEVESILKTDFDTSDIACSGKDDDLRIFIVDAAIEDELLNHVVTKIGINRGLFRIKVLPEIPKNNAGKVLYGELLKIEL